jgi:ribosome-binding protein aMBF1 (putative translation factor)
VTIDYPSAIRKLRAKLNLSQQDLAKMLGVAFTSVNRWENGHHEPTIIAKEKLKELFKIHNIELEEK